MDATTGPQSTSVPAPPAARSGCRQAGAVAPNVLDRTFEAAGPNRKWIAEFTYVWTAEGWLYVAAVIELYALNNLSNGRVGSEGPYSRLRRARA
jgi:hypothetical protein